MTRVTLRQWEARKPAVLAAKSALPEMRPISCDAQSNKSSHG